MKESGSNSPADSLAGPPRGRRAAKHSHEDGSPKTDQDAAVDRGGVLNKPWLIRAIWRQNLFDPQESSPRWLRKHHLVSEEPLWAGPSPFWSKRWSVCCARHAKAGEWDLRSWTIVLPSGLARRRLQELLALRAQQASIVLYPPQIVTVGQLPEYLYVAQFPFASDLVQVLTWVSALQATPTESLQQILPQPPHRDATEQWLELGKMLSGLHRELASDSLDFEMVQKALINHPESPRWQALSAVQKRYLDKLQTLGLWDIQTARLTALRNKEPQTDRQILVIGAVDLNRTQRGFLQAVAANVKYGLQPQWNDPTHSTTTVV